MTAPVATEKLSALEQEILREVRENDPEKCDHGKYLWCETCNTRSYEQGQDVGAEGATRVITKALGDAASKLFLEGHDEKARGVRELLSKIDVALKEWKGKTKP